MIIDSEKWKLPFTPSFIVFEGINGAGKSTLLRGVAEFLESKKQKVRQTREPGGTELGTLLRKIVQETPMLTPDPMSELLIFSADRAEHVRKVIRPSTASGSWVLSDRYLYSSIAFQGFGRGMDRKRIEEVTSIAIDGELPALVVLVDLSPEEAFNRLGARDGRDLGLKDRFEKEGIEFHRRIREGFLSLAHERSEPFLILDGMRSIEELLRSCCALFDSPAIG